MDKKTFLLKTQFLLGSFFIFIGIISLIIALFSNRNYVIDTIQYISIGKCLMLNLKKNSSKLIFIVSWLLIIIFISTCIYKLFN